jgi:hypothetical protein
MLSQLSRPRAPRTDAASIKTYPGAAKPRRVDVIAELADAPDEMLLAPAEVSALTGFAEETLRLWRKQNRGPAWRMVEGMPRLTMGAYREWLAKAA